MNPSGFPSRSLAGMTPEAPDQQAQTERAVSLGLRRPLRKGAC